jgi:ABC-type polysaccharide/polyol phosphate export permease
MYVIEKNGQHTTVKVVNLTSIQALFGYIWQQSKMRIIELWFFRELIQNLVVRDLKVRYKNSILGVIWSLLNPLLMMIVFTAVFTVMRGQAIENFPVFVLVGLLPWQFFSNSVSMATASIVGNAHLINKVYFPKEVLVISSVLSNLVNFLIALLVLIPILIFFGISITPWILLLPLMIFIQFIFILGIAFIVATANVFYRDVQMIMEVVLLAGFFLTPVFYSLDILPRSYMLFGIDIDVWRLTYWLNPMASIIANYRVIIFDGASPAFDFLSRILITTILFLLFGLAIFYRYQARFSEEV